MEFNAWVQAQGFDPETLTDDQRKSMSAMWRAAHNPPQPPADRQQQQEQTTDNRPAADSGFNEKMRAIQDEADRQNYIREAVVRACQQNVGNPEKIKMIRELGESAIADQKVTRQAFDLNLLRADRFATPLSFAPAGSGQGVNAELLEAAVCLSHKLPNVEKRFNSDTLEMAQKRFRRGLGLRELLVIAAERNSGYRGSTYDEVSLCKAAFPRGDYQTFGPMANAPSTIDVAGILSNVANKFLAEGFLFTEQSWREIARIRSANDFKTISTYRMTGSAKFEKVPPGGEIKHGTLGELPYTNKVETYGRMLGFDRQDIINDDLGAFTQATSELARGASDSLNEVFWTEWLDDAAFFNTDKSKGNYDDGATDSVLSLAGLENADAIFAAQTKPDGTPLGAMPAILLVPRGLRATAMTLMAATGVMGQGFNAAVVPNANPWAGMFRVVSSIYLAKTAIGGSATAWYLLADPANIAGIEVAFLFGREAPVVETSEFDFSRLGLSMRAYMDFGCNKQEYRCGVKLKGAA